MVRLTVALNASSPRSAWNLLDALRFLTTGTRLEPGCRECSVWVDPESTVHYVEAWESEDDMKRRVLSSRFTSLLAVIESADVPPEVRFDFVSSTRGLDYVTQVRQNPES
jgi:quinol monooxygenase YgiN